MQQKTSPSRWPSKTEQALLQQVRIVLVTQPDERRRFQRLLKQHHYLGDLQPMGEQLYFAAVDAQGHWVALPQLSQLDPVSDFFRGGDPVKRPLFRRLAPPKRLGADLARSHRPRGPESQRRMYLKGHTRRQDGKEHRCWSLMEKRRVADGRVLDRPLLSLWARATTPSGRPGPAPSPPSIRSPHAPQPAPSFPPPARAPRTPPTPACRRA